MIELAEAIGETISSSSRESQLADHVTDPATPAVEFSSVARYVCLSILRRLNAVVSPVGVFFKGAISLRRVWLSVSTDSSNCY